LEEDLGEEVPLIRSQFADAILTLTLRKAVPEYAKSNSDSSDNILKAILLTYCVGLVLLHMK